MGKLKGYFGGFFTATLIFGLIASASAASVTRQLDASYNDISIYVDGNKVNTSNEPFIVEGTTYLPVRAVADALGLGVEWVGETQSIYLTSEALEVFAPAYTEPEDPEESTVLGTVYWVSSGERYHATSDCPTLARSTNIQSGTLQEAAGYNKTEPCSVCTGG